MTGVGSGGMQQLQQGMAHLSTGGGGAAPQQAAQTQQQSQMYQHNQQQQQNPPAVSTSIQPYGAQSSNQAVGIQQPTLNGGQKRVMVAKFDYDSRQLSPNVDAEQVRMNHPKGSGNEL